MKPLLHALMKPLLLALLQQAFRQSGHALFLLGITVPVDTSLIVVQGRIDVDEVDVLELLLRIRLKLQQATDGLGIDVHLVMRRPLHVRQVEPGHQIVAVQVVRRRDAGQQAAQIVKCQIGVAPATQFEPIRYALVAAQEDHHRHHPLGLAQFGQVQAVVPQPMDGKTCRVAFLFEDEQQRFAPAIRPFHQ